MTHLSTLSEASFDQYCCESNGAERRLAQQWARSPKDILDVLLFFLFGSLQTQKSFTCYTEHEIEKNNL